MFRGASALLIVTQLMEDESEPFDLDDSNPVTVSFLVAFTRLQRIRKSQYYMMHRERKSALKIFEDDLHVNEDGLYWLNDYEFNESTGTQERHLIKLLLQLRTIKFLHKELEATNRSL